MHVPLLDEAGKAIRWYGVSYDIEDRKIVENALRESETRLARAERELRLTLDTIPTLAWRTDPNGSAEYLNKRWLDFTGFSLEQGLGWNWQHAIHPDDRRGLLEAWQRMLESGKSEDVEARMRRHDGVYRWFLFRAETLRDDSGNIVAWFGTNTDIEDRKQAEGSLKRTQAYSAEAQKLSQTGSIVWDMARENHFWSEEAYQITGFDRGIKPSLDLFMQRVHPDDRYLVLHEARRVASGEQNFDYEHRLLMDDGQIKYVKVRARRVRHDTGKEEIVGALMDITATRRSQEALHAARTALAHASRVATLGEINATIAHEVNQPLAAIVANAETSLRRLAGESPDYDRVRRAIEWIAKDARRAGDVIHRVRGLSRKADTQKMPLDLNEVIGEVNALLHRDLAVHRVTLSLELAPSLPLVMGDRVQLQQVIINLVMNAVEAMQVAAGGAKSLVVRSCHIANGVVVAVTDSGTGISDETKGRLFDAFFSTKPKGLGIGLSICRSIIEDHDGRLSAANNSGKPGATFKFELPSLLDQAA
jgi:PAS domain S-box-containing protein